MAIHGAKPDQGSEAWGATKKVWWQQRLGVTRRQSQEGREGWKDSDYGHAPGRCRDSGAWDASGGAESAANRCAPPDKGRGLFISQIGLVPTYVRRRRDRDTVQYRGIARAAIPVVG